MSKGSHRRPTDEKKFAENFDAIFRNGGMLKVWVECDPEYPEEGPLVKSEYVDHSEVTTIKPRVSK